MTSFFIFAVFTISFALDVWRDIKDSLPLNHIWHEVLLFMIALIGAVWQFWTLIRKQKEIEYIRKEFLQTKESYLSWQQKSRNSAEEIRKMIDQQFTDWKLTESEKDVALLLIKGLSMKEIADIRATQDKTVRQQAATIYRKANLSGRQELAAFFLEDILSTT